MRTFVLLMLLGGCAEPTAELPAEQLAPAIRTSLNGLFAGLSSSLEIRNLPPGATVFVAATGRGLGPGPCPAGFTDCVGIRPPYAFVNSVTASSTGSVDVDFVVPNLVGRQVCFQAAVANLSLMLAPICADINALP